MFDEFINGKKVAIYSDVTIEELREAPYDVREKLKLIPEQFFERLHLFDEVENLAKAYIHNEAISQKSYEDALHIAFAALSKVDVLVSWNFKHIVNIYRINKYNSVNLLLNYKVIDIRSPMEVLYYEEDF